MSRPARAATTSAPAFRGSGDGGCVSPGRRRAARRCGCRLPVDMTIRQRAAGLPAAPDLSSPVGRPLCAVECGADRHHHRRTDRLEPEFLLASPAHLDRLPRPAKRDDRRIGRCIIGAVVAIAGPDPGRASPKSPPDRASRCAQSIAQWVHALRMRPHRKPPVAVDREPAGRRD
jgi:hypothetical protein